MANACVLKFTISEYNANKTNVLPNGTLVIIDDYVMKICDGINTLENCPSKYIYDYAPYKDYISSDLSFFTGEKTILSIPQSYAQPVVTNTSNFASLPNGQSIYYYVDFPFNFTANRIGFSYFYVSDPLTVTIGIYKLDNTENFNLITSIIFNLNRYGSINSTTSIITTTFLSLTNPINFSNKEKYAIGFYKPRNNTIRGTQSVYLTKKPILITGITSNASANFGVFGSIVASPLSTSLPLSSFRILVPDVTLLNYPFNVMFSGNLDV